jgi:putative membrane protein
MFSGIIYFAINVVVILGLSQILPNFEVVGVVPAAIFIIVLSILNGLVVPILKILTFPVSVLTFGLINGLIIILAVLLATLVQGVDLSGGILEQLISLVIIAAILAVTQSLAHKWIDN